MKLKRENLILILVVAFFSFGIWWNSPWHHRVKPGQIWVYKVNDENPFSEIRAYTNVVLDCKNGYVLYYNDSKSLFMGGTNSESESWFIIGSKRIR